MIIGLNWQYISEKDLLNQKDRKIPVFCDSTCTKQFRDRSNAPAQNELTFCIGRSLTGTLQTRLLAFLDAGIAGEQTGM